MFSQTFNQSIVNKEGINSGMMIPKPLDFLWLEITSRCNLECIHCYADSSPLPKTKDQLSSSDYLKLIHSASQLGCEKIQFIGGEPTIVKELPQLISYANNNGFSFIEVYTNATNISDGLLDCFVSNKVHVATSFYSYKPETHDFITKKTGSFEKTKGTLQKFLNAKLNIRVGIIEMPENNGDTGVTTQYLNSLGITNISVDRIRSFGRGKRISINEENSIQELCGSCWKGNLCIFPDGNAAPCIMSKNWTVGSVLEKSLEEIINSLELKRMRQRIYQEHNFIENSYKGSKIVGSESSPSCQPNCNPNCGPNCMPNECLPVCVPNCSPNCSPCFPYGKCNPELFKK